MLFLLFHPIHKELRIGMALLCCSLEPLVGGVCILLYTLTLQVQLAQQILRPRIFTFCRLMEVFCCLSCVFVYMLAAEILLTQDIGGVVVSVFGGRFHPADTLARITHIRIVREKQSAQGILRGVDFVLCRLLQPMFGFLCVWDI